MIKLLTVIVALCICLAPAVPVALAERSDDCVNLVNKCLSLMKEKGLRYSLRAMNMSRLFCDKEVYVFAFSLDDLCVAHPYKPLLVGDRVADLKDTDGKLFVQELKPVAQGPGSGWVEYKWLRLGEAKPRSKRSYISILPGSKLYIGAGYYPDSDPASPVMVKNLDKPATKKEYKKLSKAVN